MNLVGFIVLPIAWVGLDYVDTFLEKKLPPLAYKIMRWVMVVPMSLIGYFVAGVFFELGVLWALLALPAMVFSAMATAPNKRWIAGICLLLFAVGIGCEETYHGWSDNKTRQWLAGSGGIALSVAVFVWMRED